MVPLDKIWKKWRGNYFNDSPSSWNSQYTTKSWKCMYVIYFKIRNIVCNVLYITYYMMFGDWNRKKCWQQPTRDYDRCSSTPAVDSQINHDISSFWLCCNLSHSVNTFRPLLTKYITSTKPWVSSTIVYLMEMCSSLSQARVSSFFITVRVLTDLERGEGGWAKDSMWWALS